MAGSSEKDIHVQFDTNVGGDGGGGGDSLWLRTKRQLNPANHSMLETVLAGIVFVLFVVVVALAATMGGWRQQQQQQTAGCSERWCLFRSVYTLGYMNVTANPCENFHEFACGGYRLSHAIDVTRLEHTVVVDLKQQNRRYIENLLAKPIARGERKSYERKLKTFFAKCTDDFLTERLRGLPLATLLSSEFYVLTPAALPNFEINALLQLVQGGFGAPAFFQYFVAPNFLDDNKLTISIDAGGLGMNSGMYFGQLHKSVIEAYKAYINTTATMLANDWKLPENRERQLRIDQFVLDVMEIETRLANITLSSERPGGSPLHPENLLSLQQLDERYKPLKFTDFFIHVFGNKVSASTKVALQVPYYLGNLTEYVNQVLPALHPESYRRMLSNYLNWRMIQRHTGDLSSAYVHARREFEAALSYTTYKYQNRFDYCFEKVERFMLKGLGGMFAKTHLLSREKKAVDEMYKDVRDHLISRIDRIQWFDPAARARAKAKIAAIRDRLGYNENEITDAFLDNYYAELSVEKDDTLLDLSLSWLNQERKRLGGKLGSAPDREEWDGATYDVNAHLNNPNMQLTVPAGFLQWPLYTQLLPSFVNYATAAQAMAAELIKAIDSGGHFFDEFGRAKPWWSADTLMQFGNRSRCTYNYFGGMRAGPYATETRDRYVNISTILGPNLRSLLAEINGLRLTHGAYRAKFGDDELPLPLSNLTTLQGFFVTWAQKHCYTRDALYGYTRARLQRVIPEEILVNGAVSLLPEFGRAFSCPAGSRLATRQCKSLYVN